jgi:hypothetical protein
MRLSSILLLFVLATTTPPIHAQLARKAWSDGKLTWDDFQKRPGSKSLSEMVYSFQTRAKTDTIDGTLVHRIAVIAMMDPSLSWATSSAQTAQMLRYNQVLFDIVELHRRLMQHGIHRSNTSDEASNVFDSYFSQHASLTTMFEQESRWGELEKVIARWEASIADSLATTPDPVIPDYTVSRIGYEIPLALGGGFYSGDMSTHFSPSFLLGTGFRVNRDRFSLGINGLVGRGVVRQSYAGDLNWNKGDGFVSAVFDLSVGYQLRTDDRPGVKPFAGVLFTEWAKAGNPKAVYGFGLSAGVEIDWLYRKDLTLIQSTKKRRVVSQHHGLRLMVATTEVEPNLRGTGVFLSYGIYIRQNGIIIN